MGTVTNPLWQSLVPGAAPSNPTGNQINLSGSGGSTGSNPLLPSTGTTAAMMPSSANPYTAGFGANTGPYTSSTNLGGAVPGAPGASPQTNVGAAAASPIGGINQMSSKDLGRLFNGLRNTYGDGMAHTIMDFLTSGAGFNQQAVDNLLASLQPGIERGTESLMTQFSATGNRFGSGAQIGLGDFLSQVNLNEGQLITKMYEDSIKNYMDVMMGVAPATATEKQNSPSAWDYAQQAASFAESFFPGGGQSGMGQKNVSIPGSSSSSDGSDIGTGGMGL